MNGTSFWRAYVQDFDRFLPVKRCRCRLPSPLVDLSKANANGSLGLRDNKIAVAVLSLRLKSRHDLCVAPWRRQQDQF